MQKQPNFCYLDIRSDQDAIVTYINIGLTSMLFLYSLRAYFRSRKAGRITKQIKIIFLFIFAWAITYIAQFSYGILIYKLDLTNYNLGGKDGQNLIKQRNNKITLYSRIYAAADTIPYFILQGTFLLIVFNLIKIIQTKMDEQYLDYFPDQKQMKFYQILKKYQFIRLIKIVHCVFLFISSDVLYLYIVQTIGICLIIVDSIICTVLFFIARKIISRKKILKQRMQSKHYKKLYTQLIILNIVSLYRCISDVVFLLIPMFIFQDLQLSQLKYPCIDQPWQITYGYLLINQFLVHFVPVFLIVNYYTIPKKYLKKSIISGTGSGTESVTESRTESEDET